MSDLYKKIILEHYKNPLNKGKLLSPDIIIEESNPLCGDHIEMFFHFKKEINKKNITLTDVSFEGKGCALCIASTSLLSEQIKNKNINDIKSLKLEDVNALLGIDVSPARVKCIMLPLVIIKKGIFKFESKGDDL